MTKSSNKLVNPNAREAMNRFKMEAASDVGVPDTTNHQINMTRLVSVYQAGYAAQLLDSERKSNSLSVQLFQQLDKSSQTLAMIRFVRTQNA